MDLERKRVTCIYFIDICSTGALERGILVFSNICESMILFQIAEFPTKSCSTSN